MDRKFIIAGAIAIGIAGVSAVAFAGIGRNTTSSETSTVDPNRPLQTLLSQVQRQGDQAATGTPIAPIVPVTNPTRLAQATPTAPATEPAIAPAPAEQPTVTPGADAPADAPAPVTTAVKRDARQSQFQPTSDPGTRATPAKVRIVRQVASGAMCK